MSESEWGRLESLFHGALEMPTAERQPWLEWHCADAPELLAEVLGLLDAAEDHDEPVDRLIAEAAAQLSQSATPRPRRLGPFRILRRLGEGGMGTVYLAERDDAQFQQLVAIKFIRGFPGDRALERFRRERQILADLQHPNIARLLDGGTTEDGQPYLVMEYIDGRPIGQWCRERPLDLAKRVRLMMAVCDAIHHAHRHLIVHRDIKPGNILVTAEGRPIVMDFGIAKLLSDDPAEATAAIRFYTPGYASPEQLENGPVTAATDVFSLGRLLLHVLDDSEDSPSQIQSQRWRRRLPRELVAIIDQATRVEPSRRYPSVAAIRADLIRFLEGRAVLAVPDRLSYRLARYVRRQRVMLSATALVLLVSISLSWRWALESERARSAEIRMLAESQHADQVLDFMLDTISSAGPGRAMGREITVREVIDRSYRDLLGDVQIDPLLRSRLLLALGEVYLRLEEHGLANELLEQAALTIEPVTAVRALSLLAFSLTLDQALDPAELALERAFQVRAQSNGLPERVERELQNHRALWLRARGQIDEAREVFEQLVTVQLAAGNSEQASRMLHNLGLAERDLGLLDRAIERFEHSLALKEKTVGTLHPSYANTLQTLARSQAQAGNYRLAAEQLQQSLAIRIQLFGDDHDGLHADYNELGNMHHDEGDFARAIEHYRQALSLHERAGSGPLSAATYFNNLASALEDQGDWAGAEPYYQRSLSLRLAGYGEQHQAVALAQHNLARLLIRQDRTQEARQLLEQALAFRRVHFGEQHHVTAYSESLLGLLAHSGGELVEADAQLGRSLKQLRAALPDRNWWVLVTRANQGRVLIDLERLDEAEALMRTLLADYDAAFGAGHPHAAALGLEMARIHLLRGETEEARPLLAAAEPVLQVHMHQDALVRRQWHCLNEARTEPACWRQLVTD